MSGVKKIYSNEIKIQKLRVFAQHGVYSCEKKGQFFILNITLNFNFDKATKFDNLNYTIDYDAFCKFVTTIFSKYKFNLLETAVKFLTEQILIRFKNLNSVTVQANKEQSVLKSKCDVKCVEIKFTNFWHTAYLSLGSNLGKRIKNLISAVLLLKRSNKIRVLKISSLFKNKAYGRKMPDFFNCAVKLKTLFDEFELLEFCNKIEQKLKRVRTIKWGPRTIDVDIIFFDNLIIHTKNLTIPHPEMLKRKFVIKPMAEIAPYLIHPINKKTMLDLANSFN